jgi:hypothetical protein
MKHYCTIGRPIYYRVLYCELLEDVEVAKGCDEIRAAPRCDGWNFQERMMAISATEENLMAFSINETVFNQCRCRCNQYA